MQPTPNRLDTPTNLHAMDLLPPLLRLTCHLSLSNHKPRAHSSDPSSLPGSFCLGSQKSNCPAGSCCPEQTSHLPQACKVLVPSGLLWQAGLRSLPPAPLLDTWLYFPAWLPGLCRAPSVCPCPSPPVGSVSLSVAAPGPGLGTESASLTYTSFWKHSVSVCQV